MKKILIFALVVSGAVSSLFAGFWDWSTPYQGPENDIITLVITVNLKTPRTIAEVIQYENNQPFILLPYRGARGIFFCPGGKNAEALEIAPAQFAQFVSFINPRRIIIIGDDNYVPVEYRQLLEYNGYAPVTFSGNWDKVVKDIASFLRLSDLERDYRSVVAATSQNHIPGRGRDVGENATVITVENQ